MEYEITEQERERRKKIAESARDTIIGALPIEDTDDSSLMLVYEGFYMQLSFSLLHPLIVIYLAKALQHKIAAKDRDTANKLNLRSVLGSHALNTEIGCYSYRSTHWLDTELTAERFFEILYRSMDEAQRGYAAILHC